MQLLLSLRDALAQSDDHDADQVNIQLKMVTAWIEWAEGDRSEAVREMRAGRCSRRCNRKVAGQSGFHRSRAGVAGRYVAFGKGAEARVGGL
jgi:hypothetical protein